MRTELLGLELTHAQRMLESEGVMPQVTTTAAPKKADRKGTLRVVYADDGGRTLTASSFVDPIADAAEKQ